MKGAGNHGAPMIYAGEYDPDRTYMPREVVKSGSAVYMATSRHSGVAPPDPAHWLVLAGPVLYEGNLADGPPTDGSPFWYVPDVSC